MPYSQKAAIERYLSTGEHDTLFAAWPAENFTARARHGEIALRGALISLVKNVAVRAVVPEELADLDVASFTRAKVEPLVRGLFPTAEQQAVLDLLAYGVVFLTPTAIEPLLMQTPYLTTAWNLSKIYLASCGSKLLAGDAPDLVGLSEGTTCYVSMDYFRPAGQFDDFVVHEAAHIFHNCKRRTIGLPEVRGREWLLDIEFGKRETFAYLCEAYSRILELSGGGTPAKRQLLSQAENSPLPSDDRVGAGEYLKILRAAVAARNGWKEILRSCAPLPRRRAILTTRPGRCETQPSKPGSTKDIPG